MNDDFALPALPVGMHYLPTAASAAFGLIAAMASKVRTDTPMSAANWGCDKPVVLRASMTGDETARLGVLNQPGETAPELQADLGQLRRRTQSSVEQQAAAMRSASAPVGALFVAGSASHRSRQAQAVGSFSSDLRSSP
jgi:hypothetical protein